MKRITIPLFFISLLVLVGCNSGPASPSVNLQPVTLQLRGNAYSEYAGYYVALEKGWYQEEGIALTIQPGGQKTDVVDDLVDGKCQFGTVQLPDLAVAVEKSRPVISIAQIEQMNGLLLISKKSSGINRPGDLIGKRIGNWGHPWETQINALFIREGIDPNSVALVSQGDNIQPFLNNEIDVISAMVYDEFHQVLENGFKLEEINVIDFTIFNLDFPGEAIVTCREMVRQNPDLCQRMLRASFRGWQYALQNNREAVDIVLKMNPDQDLDRKHQLSMLREVSRLVQVSWREMGYTDSSTVQKMLNTLRSQKRLQLNAKPDAFFTNEFWDKANQALKIRSAP